MALDFPEDIPCLESEVLIIGSGAAGLNAALRLHVQGVEHLRIITEGLQMGTSINTGSDKQTYYKLAGTGQDSPEAMAADYFEAGGMHGDLALVEAALSSRAFHQLLNLGVPFPVDAFGRVAGYQTDHDQASRGTSTGPYTSRDMCLALQKEIQRRNIPIDEGMEVAKLIHQTHGQTGETRCMGAIALDRTAQPRAYLAPHVIFAVGGPGGLYHQSVYPKVHNGAIGLAMEMGARCRSLPEFQFGLSSTAFRWNVSGSYMQCIPRFISRAQDGSDEKEFLLDHSLSQTEILNWTFLKGYQWPFHTAKLPGGSSILDILVHIETTQKKRRVFLDFRTNPQGYAFKTLSPEAQDYLHCCHSVQERPIERLQAMNPKAIKLYRTHGIELEKEPLEIAVCAQHNNGGLAADHWWQSENIQGFYPVGEVNGSHGVARPGGSALNSGQVGGFRIADFISAHPATHWNPHKAQEQAQSSWKELQTYLYQCTTATKTAMDVRSEFQQRMTAIGAHIRSSKRLTQGLKEAQHQFAQLLQEGCLAQNPQELRHAVKNRQLCLAHLVYLDAMLFQVESGVGSRSSALVLNPEETNGQLPLAGWEKKEWEFSPEDVSFRDYILETEWKHNRCQHRWVPCHPISDEPLWFESVWANYHQSAYFQGWKISDERWHSRA